VPAERDDQRSTSTRGVNGVDRASVYLKMELAGKALRCLLDSGCEVTLVLESVVKKAKSVNVMPSLYSTPLHDLFYRGAVRPRHTTSSGAALAEN